MKKSFVLFSAIALLGLGISPAHAGVDGTKLFKAKCKMCHSIDKKKVGPAVKAMNTDASVLRDTIVNGRKMMPRFGKKLDTAQVDALVAYIQAQQGTASDK